MWCKYIYMSYIIIYTYHIDMSFVWLGALLPEDLVLPLPDDSFVSSIC